MYVAFDIEIAEPFPSQEEQERGIMPYNMPVSCAAIAVYSAKEDMETISFGLGDRMSPSEVRGLVSTLSLLNSAGYTITSWNGLGFDFRCLHHWATKGLSPFASQLWSEEIILLARTHIDPAFLMLCDLGYMISLSAVAEALNLEGKTKGMRGPLAPLLWSGLTGREDSDTLGEIASLGCIPGSLPARSLCQEYVKQDAITTLGVYLRLLDMGLSGLRWRTQSGRLSRTAWSPPRNDYGDLLSASEAPSLPMPDTSWMKAPARGREEYIGWTEI